VTEEECAGEVSHLINNDGHARRLRPTQRDRFTEAREASPAVAFKGILCGEGWRRGEQAGITDDQQRKPGAAEAPIYPSIQLRKTWVAAWAAAMVSPLVNGCSPPAF